MPTSQELRAEHQRRAQYAREYMQGLHGPVDPHEVVRLMSSVGRASRAAEEAETLEQDTAFRERVLGQVGRESVDLEAFTNPLAIQYAQQYIDPLIGQQAAPTAEAAQIDLARQDELRQRQMGLAEALRARASGEAPSLAELQLREGQDRATSQAMALAASQPGVSPGAALRMALQSQTAAAMDTSAQAAQLRAQEQMQAEQALAGLLGQGRAADIGLAQTQAQMQQQAALANQQAALQQAAHQRALLGMGQQAREQYVRNVQSGQQLGLQAGGQFAQTGTTLRGQDIQQELGERGLDIEQQQADLAREEYENRPGFWQRLGEGVITGAVGGLAQGAGASLAKSDRRSKKNVTKTSTDIDRFLTELRPYRFDYKKTEDGGKNNYGFMAQDAEKSEVGKSLVVDTPEGKMIDKNRALMLALASAARMNERLTKLEKKNVR